MVVVSFFVKEIFCFALFCFVLLSRFYTVRYREKGKDKKWVFQLCPVTETVVDNLKPNTIYEFGVKDNVEDSIWSKTFNHKTVLSSKYVTIINQIATQFDYFFLYCGVT